MRRRRSQLFNSPFGEARDRMLRALARPFRRFSPKTRYVTGTAIIALITTAVLSQPLSPISLDRYREGDVVRDTVISPADIVDIDEKEQERKRAAALATVQPVFRYDPSQTEATINSFRASWARHKEQGPGPASWPELPSSGEAAEFARLISERGFKPSDLEQLTGLLRQAGTGYVYEDAEAAHLAPEIRLIDTRSGVASQLGTLQYNLQPLRAVRASLERGVARLGGWNEAEKRILSPVLLTFVRPNLTFDRAATERARQEATASVPPATFILKRNQVVAREGDTVTEHMLAQFSAIGERGPRNFPLTHFIGLLLMVAALYWMAWKFTEHRSVAVSFSLPRRRAFLLVTSAILVETVLMRIGYVISDSVASQSAAAPFNDPTTTGFAIPFAAAALLVALLVDAQLGLLTGVVCALFAGLLAPDGITMACYAMVSAAASIYGIKRYRERQSVTLAGVFVALVNAVMAVAVILFVQQTLSFRAIFFAIICGLAGGLMTTIFTAGGLPINESLFGVLTDVKLLELSNADLPVLSQMALRAPGTNQHSHAVGQLAEDACRSIGANALLARIGALYHDIGKLAAPDMFIENQHGDNPHDRLRPSNSARIITSHVTYGLRLAKEIGLPKPIADFIPQHHGTRTLHYFLRKAQAQAAPDEVVDEAEFRYPGPKPQFKEAAIMMLADSCEAAARSLARPDPENIRAIVTKIVDAILSDGQLDECDLTLRELKLIRESVISSLVAIYHARIDYPGFNPPATTGPLPPLPDPALDTEERGLLRPAGGSSYVHPVEVPISRGGEVEDEAVRGPALGRR